MTAASASAFSWQLWRRGSRPAVALLLYCGALAFLAHAPGAAERRETLLMATMPLGFGALLFLAGFAFPEGDVLARHSGFPTWMLVVPARTWELALWPILHGAAATALCWLLPAYGIFAPLGVPVSVWPAALIAALLATLQALLWTPVGLPYLRILLAVIIAPLLVTAGVSAALNGAPPVSLAAAFGIVVGLAYAAAVAGLARARRGDVPDWSLRSRAGRWALGAGWGGRLRREFELSRSDTTNPAPSAQRPALPSSPIQAQLWYEWRAGKALPMLIAALGGVFSLPFVWVREMAPLLPGGSLAVNLWLKILLPGLFALPLLAAVVGCGRRKWEGRRELSLPWFVAIRPVDDAQMVAARFGMAARSTVTAWGIALGIFTLWMLFPGQDGLRSGPFLFLLLERLTVREAFVALTAVGFLVLWTWKNQVQGLWADVSGRAAIVHGAPIVAHNAVLAAFLWVAEHARPLDLDAPVSTVFWVTAGSLVALKSLAATVALRTLRRRGQLTLRTLAALIAGWLLVALTFTAALAGVGRYAPPPGSLEDLIRLTYLPFLHPIVLSPAYREPLVLFLLALLFLPLARLAAAPLTLGWNRRR